jgi:tetratricopeptide (TPR) repeat protein
MLGLRPFFESDRGLLAEDKKRLPPLTILMDAVGGVESAMEGQLPPQLMRSYQQALGVRWARINRDIRQFNRQYGYWDDWGHDFDENSGLELSRSAAANWYGGLEGFMDKEVADLILPMGYPRSAEAQVSQLLPAGELPMLAKGLKAEVAVAWISSVGQTMKSLPGSCSVLAADHLVMRHDELKKQKTLTDEQKQELAALEESIRNVEEAAAKLESSDPFWSHRGWDYRPRPATIEPPSVQAYHGYNWSYDLTSYAPGLYSTAADILSEVVAQYGMPPATGKVSAEARRRIEAARAAIKPVSIAYGKDGPAVLAAAGDRFAVTRRTDMYLEERMVCDGGSVLHLYEELGLAARRPASELRLTSLRQLAPHFLEPADALARIFNVELGEANDQGFTLRLAPVLDKGETKVSASGKNASEKATSEKAAGELPDIRLTMTVRHDGLVTEKALFVDSKPVARLTYEYARAGQAGPPAAAHEVTARWLDKENKELAKFEFTAQPLDEPKAFETKLADYVVFDMPLRKPSYYADLIKELSDKKPQAKEARRQIDLLRHQALASIQDLQWRRWGGSNSEAQELLSRARKLSEQSGAKPMLGDLTLLGSTGASATDFADEQSDVAKRFEAVYRYFRNRHSGWPEAKAYPQTLAGHLATYHWAVTHAGNPAMFRRFLDNYGDSPLVLAAAYYCSNYGQKAEVWFPLFDDPKWRALAMLMSGRQEMTAEHLDRLDAALSAWYRDVSKNATTGVFDLPITPQIASRLADRKGWEAAVADQFARAKKADGAAALLWFAESAVGWGKKSLADGALALARDRLKVGISLREMNPLAERAGHTGDSFSARLALGQAYWACGRPKEALELYNELLADLKAKQLPASAALLAATARLAAEAGDQARAIELEEEALAIEHQRLPDMVNLQAYRQRYQWLWERLSAKVGESAGNDPAAMNAWLARAEQAWRQWHEVDRENAQMIHQMATLQRRAGREDRAWLYLSTLIDQRPKDAASHSSLAQWYMAHNELNRAEQFYASAHTWDLANPQWLFERAQLLDRLDRKAEARELYQTIIDGKWPPGRQGYVEQAKKALK